LLRIGLVGLGLSAKKFHIPVIKCLPFFKITTVFSRQAKSEIERLVGNVIAFNDFSSFCQSKSFDVAVVLTPNYLHHSMTMKLLEAGMHVIVDKPIATNFNEANGMCLLAKRKNLVLSVFHNRRWDSDFLTVKQIVRQNKLGDLHNFESRFDKYRPKLANRWREQKLEGSGILHDIGPHLIDQALSLFGMPLSIKAHVECQRPNAVVNDYFNIVMTYPSLDVVLNSNSISETAPFRFNLEGSEGRFIKQGTDIQESVISNPNFHTLEHEWPSEDPEQYGTLFAAGQNVTVPSIKGDYREYYMNIFNVIVNDAKAEISHADILNVMTILDAAQQSQQHRRSVAIKKIGEVGNKYG
jgi:scyllo-inositol 2-dehydrogenase (NADP+)